MSLLKSETGELEDHSPLWSLLIGSWVLTCAVTLLTDGESPDVHSPPVRSVFLILTVFVTSSTPSFLHHTLVPYANLVLHTPSRLRFTVSS